MAAKKDLDAQVEAKKKESSEHELKMRLKASMVGNIVGTAVPVSQTEVLCVFISHSMMLILLGKG